MSDINYGWAVILTSEGRQKYDDVIRQLKDIGVGIGHELKEIGYIVIFADENQVEKVYSVDGVDSVVLNDPEIARIC